MSQAYPQDRIPSTSPLSATASAGYYETPRARRINPLLIPQELRDRGQWVVWRLETRDGKPTKVLYQARNYRRKAKSNDPKTWASFDDSMAAFLKHQDLDGIGLVFAPDGGLAGIDLDDCICIGSDRTIAEWALPYLKRFLGGWGAISPSGQGIKIIVCGSLGGAKGTRKGGFGPDGKGAVECYDKLRFFTITSDVLDTDQVAIEGDHSAELQALHAELTRKPEKTRRQASPKAAGRPAALDVDDEALLEKARAARNGAKLSALYDAGDTSGYPSESEADFALLTSLAFWTGRDAARMERLFDRSALGGRGKWRDRPDYRARSIANACEATREVYSPRGGNGHAAAAPSSDMPPASDKGDTAGPRPRERLLDFGNFHESEHVGEDGKAETRRRYLTAPEILDVLLRDNGGWPKRTFDGLLFYPDRGPHGVRPGFLTSANQFFAYLAHRFRTRWGRGDSAIGREVFYEFAKQAAEAFESIQAAPHWPRVDGVYYLHDPVPDGGVTGALDEYLGFYAFASEADRELGRAFIATPYWGGPPGSRPAFVITTGDEAADGGVGHGKTTFAHAPALGRTGFTVAVSRSSDIDVIKARLLSADGMRARLVAMDNIKSMRLSSEDIESLVTDLQISGKRMYVGEASIPNLYAWVLTLNDPALSRDMARRSVPIRMGRAAYSGAWVRRLDAFLRDRRSDILRDIRHLLLAPTPEDYRPASRWAAWEVEVLAKCGSADLARQRFLSAQEDLNEDAREAEAVRDHFRSELAWLGGNADLDPTKLRAVIPSPIAADWLNKTLRKSWAANAACRRLNALRIPELTLEKRRSGNVWIWQGARYENSTPLGTHMLRKGEKGLVTYVFKQEPSVEDVEDVEDRSAF